MNVLGPTLSLFALTLWLAGCAGGLSPNALFDGPPSASPRAAATTGGAGGGATGADAGVGEGGGGASGGMGPGAPCTAAAAASCAKGLVCGSAGSCIAPGYGEACDADVGCAASPQGMGCVEAVFHGVSEALCLVACDALDSSHCPYLTSCGDPNLPGYCSLAGSGTCTVGEPCTLGPSVVGACLPMGTRTTCVAVGTVASPFGACDPLAVNSDAAALCAEGLVCVAAPSISNLAPTGEVGACFSFCGPDGGCARGEHCDPGDELCHPGDACELGVSGCRKSLTCVPDGPNALAGGCLAGAPDAGPPGVACVPPAAGELEPCRPGDACLPSSDGGTSCEPLCALGDGGPGCSTGTCTALAGGGPSAVVGGCGG